MKNSVFLQSETSDPYAFYARMRTRQPVWHDADNDIWALYAYADCKRVLETDSAQIPAQHPDGLSLLNKTSISLINHLARLANPPSHTTSRQAVLRLCGHMQPVDTIGLLARLLGTANEIDWVEAVCKKLPGLAVMTAFGFSEQDKEMLLPKLEGLTKIMLPNKSMQQAAEINALTEEVWPLIERNVAQQRPASAAFDASHTIHVANLIGLLIQSYDAGRGILSNALLQWLQNNPQSSSQPLSRDHCRRVVMETLRFDPPIQNTRRVLTEDLTFNDTVLPKGANVLVVLASANRDEHVFEQADRFDITRSNANAHLTFGAGAHRCAAHHFAVEMTADVLSALFNGNRKISLLAQEIPYAPMVNARLPEQLWMRCSSASHLENGA